METKFDEDSETYRAIGREFLGAIDKSTARKWLHDYANSKSITARAFDAKYRCDNDLCPAFGGNEDFGNQVFGILSDSNQGDPSLLGDN